jgi:hypothetical protein
MLINSPRATARFKSVSAATGSRFFGLKESEGFCACMNGAMTDAERRYLIPNS